MISAAKGHATRLLMRWVAFVQRHALPVVAAAALISTGVLFYSVRNFRIDADLTGMISENLPFRKLEKDFSRAFPNLNNTIVVVINADSVDRAIVARDRLAGRLRSEKGLFKSVYEPGGGSFFKRNGLLYMKVDELQDFSDRMSAAQPLIALLSRDLSLKGLFSVLQQILQQPKEEGLKDARIDVLYKEVGAAFNSAVEGRPHHVPWQRMMLGEKGMEGQRRQFIILQPYSAGEGLSSGEKELGAVRSAVRELGLYGTPGITVLITGDVALSYENLQAVRETVGLATLASLILVALIIYIGLGRSGRLIFSALSTLIMGLVWTTGFAVAFIGSLNMISVTFAVLYIGLGIDYSIQFCLRYRELLKSGAEPQGVIVTTASGVGKALFLSCITTAIGFYSFVPTAYAGVAELGLIAGTGMFISFFANLTVLPALLTLFPAGITADSRKVAGKGFLDIPYRYSRAICIGALILGIGAAIFLPRIYFDYNPMSLYDRKAESVIAAEELFKKTEMPPWTASVLAGSGEQARELAERLSRLKQVKMAITLFDFVPEKQNEKMGIISDVAFLMPPGLDRVEVRHSGYEEDLKALASLQAALKKRLMGEPDNPYLRELYSDVERFRKGLDGSSEEKKPFSQLEEDLVSGLPGLFRMLGECLDAYPCGLSDLPRDLVSQYVSTDGRYRVQVFPAEDIMNNEALARFVNAVRTVAPEATDAPVTIYESGRAIISSFRHATIYALVAIAIVLLLEARSVITPLFILIPLALAMLLTGAASVFLGIPLNFANVIVAPLLLGIGVHSGIIFILRYQTEPPSNGNMLQTSTARAILFSSLTTMISTGSLSFSPHRGLASIGIYLTICFGFLIIATLILLPAVLNLAKGRGRLDVSRD